jgi:hypothetical protein
VSNLELEARGDSESSQEDISMILNGRLGPGGAGYFVDVPYRNLMLVGLGSPVVGYGTAISCSFGMLFFCH